MTTAAFLPELRSDPALAAYGILGLTVAGVGLAVVFRRRHDLLAIAPLDVDRTLLPRRATLQRHRRDHGEDQR